MNVPEAKAVQMLTETPAKIAKINSKVGSIEVGKRADILLFEKKAA